MSALFETLPRSDADMRPNPVSELLSRASIYGNLLPQCCPLSVFFKASDMTDARGIAQEWLRTFSDALAVADAPVLATLFTTNGYFRDLLTFSWDFRTLHGRDDIIGYLQSRTTLTEVANIRLDLGEGLAPAEVELKPGSPLIFAAFNFETKLAHGRGSFRLVPTEIGRTWKALCAVMMVIDWKGYEEMGPETVVPSTPWSVVEEERKTHIKRDPYVLIGSSLSFSNRAS